MTKKLRAMLCRLVFGSLSFRGGGGKPQVFQRKIVRQYQIFWIPLYPASTYKKIRITIVSAFLSVRSCVESCRLLNNITSLDMIGLFFDSFGDKERK